MLRVKTVSMKLLSDLTTPVSIFLKLREHFPEILLLESSDYSSKEDSQSFICFDPILTLQFENGNFIFTNKLTGETENSYCQNSVEAITRFLSEIECNNDQITERFNGVFGYTGFDMVQEFEGVQFDSSKPNYGISGLRYDFFRNIIVFDHFYGELFLIENVIDGQTIVSGIALIFTQEFNKFSELWDALVKSKSKEEAKLEAEKIAAEEAQKAKQEATDESIEQKKD